MKLRERLRKFRERLNNPDGPSVPDAPGEPSRPGYLVWAIVLACRAGEAILKLVGWVVAGFSDKK